MVCIIPKNKKQFVSIGDHISRTQVVQTDVPQGSVLGSLLFLLYINDLNKSIINSSACHFADDTNILLSNKSLEQLAKKRIKDLKNLSQLWKANNLSLNAKKTELILCHSKNTKLDYSIKFKLSGKTLNSISTVQYLGILPNEHLLWTKQVNWINSKLNEIIGILSKLRYNTSLPILKIVYYSLLGSYLRTRNLHKEIV